MTARHAVAADSWLMSALGAAWLAGHLAAAALLGMTIHDQQQLVGHSAPIATTPSEPPLSAAPGEER